MFYYKHRWKGEKELIRGGGTPEEAKVELERKTKKTLRAYLIHRRHVDSGILRSNLVEKDGVALRVLDVPSEVVHTP